MRSAFIDQLVLLARENEKIVLVVGDLGFSVVERFAREFPTRFINAGVAEQNMTGLAAGLAAEGFHVFTYSIANFPTFRCAEQIRNDICYHNLPVTVVSVGGGLTYGALGYSHHAVQDYALMRTLPNMLIAAPGDPQEVRACLKYIVSNPQPSYLRLGKQSNALHHVVEPEVSPGRWLPLQVGSSSRALISTGGALPLVMAQRAAGHYLTDTIFTLPLWSMSSKKFQFKQASHFKEVVTFEDHLYDGGFGSWFAESIIQDEGPFPLVRMRALDPIVCGVVGSPETLNAFGGLS
jgi:transketolase